MRNVFTGKEVIVPSLEHKNLPRDSAIAVAIDTLHDYRFTVSGMGLPGNPPLPVDIAGPYHVAVTCRVAPRLCSTCDLHDESAPKKVPFFGEPTEKVIEPGLFSHPHTLQTIEVPGAGCAQF